MRRHRTSIVDAALVGAMAGIAASLAMNGFQQAVEKVQPSTGEDQDDPATVKAAEWAAGHALPDARKSSAGNQVHYAFGAFLGALYGAAAERLPVVKFGFGMAYGLAVAAVADEVAVPAAGLSGPPWQSPPSTHAYSVASHLVFGAALEAARRLLLAV